MAIETLFADAHITGAFSNPQNAVGPATGTWAGDLNVNVNYTSRWSLADPANSPLTSGTQIQISVVAKKGTNSGTPTIQINLWHNGVQVGTGSTL